MDHGGPAAARTELREIGAAYGTELGPEHPQALGAAFDLALAERDLGNHDEAARILGAVLAVHEIKLGPDHHNTLATRETLAEIGRRVA